MWPLIIKVCRFILVIPSWGLLWECTNVSGQLRPMAVFIYEITMKTVECMLILAYDKNHRGVVQLWTGSSGSKTVNAGAFHAPSVMLLCLLRALMPCFLQPFCTKSRVFASTWDSLQQSPTAPACFPGHLKKWVWICFHENSRNSQTNSRFLMRLPAFLQASAAKIHVFRRHFLTFSCQTQSFTHVK